MSKNIGYIRVSSWEQNPERQLEGKTLDKVFLDKASGKDIQRPQLEALLDYVREGDCVFVHSMDRLARNLDDLRGIVAKLNNKHVQLRFLKEQLTFNGEDAPMATLLLSIMGAFAEFERDLIRERQREGIDLAKKRGAYKGRKKVLSANQVLALQQRVSEGENKSQLARDVGISRETLYQYLKRNE
jgi:DNA invertase Pin-like site-specific DNA recombinase